MDERVRFVADLGSGALKMAELCRMYGIARKTGYKWRSRYRAEGVTGLVERSRAPQSNSRSVDPEVCELLIKERKAHDTWGARKLLARLGRQYPKLAWPSASGAHEILRRGGLVDGHGCRSRLSDESEGLTADGPNAVWSADYKGEFRLGNGALCYALTISDSYSRFLLACGALKSTSIQEAWSVFDATFRAYGLPEVLRTDNGSPFASSGAGRLTRLSVWWLKLGIVLDRIRPGHPEENGRHERMHRTLKAETTRPAGYDHGAQDQRFETFRREYNEERPHEALGQEPPWEHYEASSRPYDGRVPEVWYPGHWEVRTVKGSGEIQWRGARYFVSQALAREQVGLLEVEDGIWWVAFLSHLVAVYDAWRDKMFPVLSGIGGRRPGFTALRAPDEKEKQGQSGKPCPDP